MSQNATAPHAGLNQGLLSLPFDERTYDFKSRSGRIYRISICAPHQDLAPEAGFPVLVVTDADVSYGAARDYVRLAASGGDIPPTVLVGVGWPDVATLSDWVVRREWDFTLDLPYEEKDEFDRALLSPHGGANDFIHFLCDELRQSVAESVRIDLGKSAIVGFSLGGALVTLLLGTAIDSYQAYGIGSAALYRDKAFILRDALSRDFRPASTTRIYLSVGELEDFRDQGDIKGFVTNYLALARHLRAQTSPGLQLKAEILPGENHHSGTLTFIRRSIEYLLAGSGL